jgi:glucosylceramidase
MNEECRFILNRIVRYILFIITLFVFVQCHDSGFSGLTVYSSSIDGDRLTKTENVPFRQKNESSLPVINVDEKTHYQIIDGFGATFNEAGMICLNSLDSDAQDKVLRMLFDPESGAGYTLMKSPIAACDFASAGPWYTYNDIPGDTSMKHFTIERDLRPNGLIPFIKKASGYGKFEIESPMDFAPDWMYYGLKHGEKIIKPEYYDALASYYSKYLQAYAASGVTINYLILFNESDNVNPNQGYSDVTYKVMGEMIKNHVVPRLLADGLPTKIQLGETCFRYDGLLKFPVVLDDPQAKKYISKLAVHGYDWDKFSSLTDLHNRYPDLPIWMTEVCYVKLPVYEFSDGEYWGNTIMNDMKNWVSGWIYWNMILDQDGGPWLTSPEHSDPDNNHQHPVVIINRNTKEVTYTGLYYYLAHFSKFVKPGAYRINCTGGSEQLNFAGFRNTDGSIVLNVINNGDDTTCKISWNKKMTIQKLKAHSITTVRWDELAKD